MKPYLVSAILDLCQLIAVVFVLFCTWKSQKSVQRYRESIDQLAEAIRRREKILDDLATRLKRKETYLNEYADTLMKMGGSRHAS